MIQPTRVLPSNAPPLHEVDSDHASQVLQEHSGNRQQNDYSYPHDSGQKYPAAVLTENSYEGHQPQHQPAHVYRQTPLQRHSNRYTRNHLGNDDRLKAEKLAKHLYTRFTQSDHYMKYRNKQPSGAKGGDKVWPDRLESAFFQALVRWPPMGRRKLHHKDKQRGRNELIADYIEELTGEARSRKQVSSHIQVLKPFVEGDSFIMKWLSKEDLCGAGHPGRWYGASTHGSGRMRSNYPVAAPHSLRNPAPQTARYDFHTLAKVKGLLEMFEPTDFQMFVQRKHGEGCVDRLHTYTGSITHPRQPDEQIQDWPTFEREYPLLTAMHTQRPLDCNILVATASLAFPTETWKDDDGSALPGVELGISFLCSSRHLPPNSQVQCQNSFYKDGKFQKDHSGHSTVPLTLSEDGATVESQVKFGSLFWARTLSLLAGRLRESEDPTKDPVEDVSAHIKSITACQEIMLTTEHGHERLLVIYWKFRLSTGSRGRAYWQKINMPAPSSTVDFLDHPKLRSDSVYDYEMRFGDASSSQLHPAQQQVQTQPSLQSPFEYDSSSGSAPTSATWPASMEDITNTAPSSAVEFARDNSFDFTNGNIHLSYDSTFDLSTFDSFAFDFSSTTDLAADPALQDYSAQDYSTQWCDNYAALDTQQHQSLDANSTSAYPTTSLDSQSLLSYDTQQSMNSAYVVESQTSQNVFGNFSTHYDQHSYNNNHDHGQAYGGAGQDVMKDEEALAALADASFLARSGTMPQQ